MTDSEPRLCQDRIDCRVGDWVLARSVPEWPSTWFIAPFDTGRSREVFLDDRPFTVRETWHFKFGSHREPEGGCVLVWFRHS